MYKILYEFKQWRIKDASRDSVIIRTPPCSSCLVTRDECISTVVIPAEFWPSNRYRWKRMLGKRDNLFLIPLLPGFGLLNNLPNFLKSSFPWMWEVWENPFPRTALRIRWNVNYGSKCCRLERQWNRALASTLTPVKAFLNNLCAIIWSLWPSVSFM